MDGKIELLKRINNLLSALGKPRAVLDFSSIDLLLKISEAEKSGKPLKVSDIRFDSRFGSPVTALKRLQKLMEVDWIIATEDPEDCRVQRLALSANAKKELRSVAEKISRAMTSE